MALAINTPRERIAYAWCREMCSAVVIVPHKYSFPAKDTGCCEVFLTILIASLSCC